MGLEFRILGPIEVRTAGRKRPLGGPKQRALLAALLLQRGRLIPSERLIEDVWAGARGESAARSLQVYVSELRKALGDPQRIRSEAGCYRLEVAPDELDADRFERLVEEGRRLLVSGEAPAALTSLDEALALWRGPPLADVAYEAFAQAEISRLEELRLVALEEGIEARLTLGRHREVLADIEALVKPSFLVSRHHDDGSEDAPQTQLSHQLCPNSIRKPEVREDELRVATDRELDSLGRACRYTGEPELASCKRRLDPLADHCIVLDEEDGDLA